MGLIASLLVGYIVIDWSIQYIKYRRAQNTPAVDGAPKGGAQDAINEAAEKIKGVLDKLGIPQTLGNIKQFAEVGVALAGIDGLRKLVADTVPADRVATTDAAFNSIRTEVASTLLASKPAA